LYFLNKECPNVSIYSGCKNTRSKIHNHHEAVNYLILGKKLWIIFPNNDNNNELCDDEFIKNASSINWLFSNIQQLKNNIEGLSIFVQNTGDIVFVPKRFFHGVINLENSHGFVYSSTIL
jgi:oxalate decarboxylase/phosphoglucose isomerase-like protein (cupin superfamily)